MQVAFNAAFSPAYLFQPKIENFTISSFMMAARVVVPRLLQTAPGIVK
jgi:hypothetical protein